MALTNMTRPGPNIGDTEPAIYPRRGTFQGGATVSAANHVVLWDSAQSGDGNWYRWAGSLSTPKEIAPGSTPATSGGVGPTTWVNVGNTGTLLDGFTMVGTIKLQPSTDPLSAVNLNQLQNSGGVYRTGVLWHHSRSNIPDGYVPGDGQTLTRALFPDVWADIAAGRVPVVADSVWLSDPSKRGCYTYGDGSTTFRVPDYNGKSSGSLGRLFLSGDGTNSLLTEGTIQRDAFQGHKMSAPGDLSNPSAAGWVTNVYPTGTSAIAATGGNYIVSSRESGLPVTDGTNGNPRTASTTYPVNVTGCYIIRVSGSSMSLGSVDPQALATAISLLSSRVTVLEGDAFTETKVANTAWTTLTLQNGWSPLSPYRNGYRKILGLLFVEASITAGAVADGTIITTFPPGYRVPAPVIVTITGVSQSAGTVSTRLAITPDGNCKVYGTSGVSSALSINIAVSLQ